MNSTKPENTEGMTSESGIRNPDSVSVTSDFGPRTSDFSLACPVPHTAQDKVLLGHGSGGRLSAELLQKIFLPAFQNPALNSLNDQALLSVDGVRLAFTTDSFVVKPLFFPGGDIGRSEEHTSELQSLRHLVCRLLLE